MCLQRIYIYIYKIRIMTFDNINNSYIANAKFKCDNKS